MAHIKWVAKKGVGASYCLDQSPDGERFGGLTIIMSHASGTKGIITITPTERLTGNMLDQSFIDRFARAAEEGVREAAHELGVNLDDFDIVLQDFAFHPIDSQPKTYHWAAMSAFRAACEGWDRYYNIIQQKER